MISKAGALKMAKEQGQQIVDPTMSQTIEAIAQMRADTQPIPTDREWFELFTGIAESLKVQADATRAELAAEAAFEASEIGGMFDDLFAPVLKPQSLKGKGVTPKTDFDPNGPVKLTTTDKS